MGPGGGGGSWGVGREDHMQGRVGIFSMKWGGAGRSEGW